VTPSPTSGIAAPFDVDLHLPRPDGRLGYVVDTDVTGAVEPCCLHGGLLSESEREQGHTKKPSGFGSWFSRTLSTSYVR
jgi:hypothetical protein